MRRSRRSRRPVPKRPVPKRGALAAVGALAVGLWLGILAGLASRPRRRDHPAQP
ncbi:MAG: hypothetical protein V7637_952 [Mycobacteriales bacterium]